MLMLMRPDKMDSSPSGGGSGGGGGTGARHVRTHLFFSSDFEGNRNNESGGGSGRNRNSGGRGSGGRSRNYNNNDNNNYYSSSGSGRYFQQSDFLSSPISDPSRPMPPTTPSGLKGRRGFGRENSRPEVTSSSSSSSKSNGGGHLGRPPFIQISCPRQTSSLTSTSGSTSNLTTTPTSSNSSSSSSRAGSTKSRGAGASGSSTPVAGRQGCVNPGGGATPRNGRKAGLAAVAAATNGKIEQVREDCFVIPAHRMGTFLPMALPFESEKSLGALSMMHVDDPKLCIILHFAEPSSSFGQQLSSLKSSLARVEGAGEASEGMLLMNMERNASYPFIMYMVINTAHTPPCAFLQSYNSIIVDELEPDRHNIGTGTNYISGYEEVATIFKAPIDIGPKTSSNPKTGYLITIFKVFPGDDREKLERSWLLWTGARSIYKHLPGCLGLRRITFHKKLWPDGGITYILLCECTDLLENITVACGFVEQLRARCCGYTALYKSVANF